MLFDFIQNHNQGFYLEIFKSEINHSGARKCMLINYHFNNLFYFVDITKFNATTAGRRQVLKMQK